MNRKLIVTLGGLAVILIGGYAAFQHFWIYIPGVMGNLKNPVQPFHEVTWSTGPAPASAPGAKRPPNVILIEQTKFSDKQGRYVIDHEANGNKIQPPLKTHS